MKTPKAKGRKEEKGPRKEGTERRKKEGKEEAGVTYLQDEYEYGYPVCEFFRAGKF
jgi:hypothetical protein